MIIETISPYLVFDEFPNRGENFIYLLSKPMSLKELRYSPFLIIYTTSYIKRIICDDLNSAEVADCIHPLHNGGFNRIKVPKKVEELKLTVLPTESATRNVMFLFNDNIGDSKTVLYTGEFTEYKKVQNNFSFIKCARAKIDELYVDQTLRQMNPLEYNNSIPKACADIQKILNSSKFEKYKLHLMLEKVGYEDLLIALARIYNKKVFLDRIRTDIIPRDFHYLFAESEKESRIIVKELDIMSKMPLAKIEKKLMFDKVITVKFTKKQQLWLPMLTDYHSDIYLGLCLIQYAPHPSPRELMDFVESANATEVHPIMH